MLFNYDTETELIVQTVRRYKEEYLVPEIERVEAEDNVSPEVHDRLRDKAIELGLFGYNLPVEQGGPGLSFRTQSAIAYELGDMPTALKRGLTLSEGLAKYVNDDQRKWLLEPVLSGEKRLNSAFTEPNGGSDLGNMRTNAKFDGTHWLLNGEKQFISDFDQSDFTLVLAVTHPEARFRERFTAFIVEHGGPGFEYTPRLKLMCWRGLHLGGFRFHDFKVDEDHILGEPGHGFDAMIAGINGARMRQGATCTGFAATVLDFCGEHAVTRRTFGQRLGDHQSWLFRLADRELEIDLGRLLVMRAADIGDNMADSGVSANDFRLAMGKCKLFCAETLGRTVDFAVQLFGAAGITQDLPIERWFRDARVYRISEGAMEIQRMQLGKAFMAKHEERLAAR